MRKSYTDYGITEERARELLKECREGKHADLIRPAAHMAAPYIEEYLIISLRKHKSYEHVEYPDGLEKIPCGRSDFYGYRRHTLAILDKMLKGDVGENV